MSQSEIQRPDSGAAPEALAQTIGRYRREANFARSMRSATPLSLALLVAIVLVHLGMVVLDTALAAAGYETGPSFFHGAKMNGLILEGGQWWRIISAMFLHGGWMHLLFNGYALFLVGPLLERFYGSRRFLVLYIVSGLGGGMASLYFTEGPSVGASGALFGLLGALMVFGWRFRKLLPTQVSRPLMVRLMPLVALNLAFGLIPGLQIDNAAHLGGLFAGVIMGLTLSSELQGPAVGWRRAALEVGFVVAFLLIAWGFVSMAQQIAVCAGSGERFSVCYQELLGL